MIITNPSQSFYTEYDAGLIEEAVILRIAGHPEEIRFRRTRNRIYDVADSEEREERFHQFHADWFLRLGLGRPLVAALGEQPSVIQKTRFCCVLPAASSQDEGADLHATMYSHLDDCREEKVALVKLRPNSFLDACRLLALLRHEFMHLHDMLDPRFGYKPLFPESNVGPAHDNLVRERYRVLWDTWIDGRLLRRGWAPDTVRERRWEEFRAAFSVDGQEAEKKFREVFDSPFQTHAHFMALALNPANRIGPSSAGRSQICPLCRFPSFSLVNATAGLSQENVEEITLDFPEWRPEHGLCLQCADLYRARRLSRSAAAALPGIYQ